MDGDERGLHLAGIAVQVMFVVAMAVKECCSRFAVCSLSPRLSKQ